MESRTYIPKGPTEIAKQLEGIFACLRDAVLVIDVDTGKIVECNPAACEMFGYSSVEMRGQRTTFLHADEAASREFTGRLCAAAEEQGSLERFELEMRKRDGAVFPAEHTMTSLTGNDSSRTVCVSVVRDIAKSQRSECIAHEQAEIFFEERSKPVRIAGTVQDITERIRTEQQLEQHATRLTLLNKLGRQIAAELEIHSVLERATSLVQESFGYHHVAIFTMDRECRELEMRTRAGSYMALYPQEHRLPLGEGMVGWVGVHGERLLSNDVRTTPQYVNLYPNTVPTLSELTVPIRVGQETVGVLDVQSPLLCAFGDNDVIVMETVADQIAVAIRNSRLYGQVQQRVNELVFLNSASQVIVSSLDLDRVLDTIMHQATRVLQMEAGSVLLLDPDTGELVFEAASGGGAERLPGQRLPPGKGIAGWVAEHGESAIVPDVRKDSRFYPRFDEASDDFSTQSILCVPLLYRGQVVGVMQALNKVGGAFTAEDQRLLEALASTAATAIENARLYERVQRELLERVRAEDALREERASLARRVAERTAELSASNAELARATRLKDEFLAAMSHELRTPLNAILGLSEALQEGVYGSLNGRQIRSLARVHESGQHLLELINDILDISKIEAGKLVLQVRPVSVESVCRSSLDLVEQMAQQKQLKVVTTLDSEVTVIDADEHRLRQILVNLLTNACKFTPEGGQIGLDVVGDVDAEAVRFAIWDTGIGIAREDMERLFKPFAQLDGGLARRYEGTGLGLALVRRLAELHGGGVSVESEGIPGKGSRFTVSLPWATAMGSAPGDGDKAQPRVVSTEASPNTFLVLLAEDNEANIATIVDYLRSRGFRVVVARNGVEAVARTREERPDLILMDIQMPEMDGLEATRRIRADTVATVSTVPIIALTALAMPGDRERCLEAGASLYLSKPVGLSQLTEAIQMQLGQN